MYHNLAQDNLEDAIEEVKQDYLTPGREGHHDDDVGDWATNSFGGGGVADWNAMDDNDGRAPQTPAAAATLPDWASSAGGPCHAKARAHTLRKCSPCTTCSFYRVIVLGYAH